MDIDVYSRRIRVKSICEVCDYTLISTPFSFSIVKIVGPKNGAPFAIASGIQSNKSVIHITRAARRETPYLLIPSQAFCNLFTDTGTGVRNSCANS